MKKGYEKMVANNLLRMENEEMEQFIPIQESFLDEQLFQVSASNLPWFANYVNFLVGQVFLLDISP